VGDGAWDRSAARVQQKVRGDESDFIGEYSNEQVRQAVIHIREDMVLLAVNLSWVNRQLAVIKWLLCLVALLATVALVIWLRHNL
jgi:hypothetical protein